MTAKRGLLAVLSAVLSIGGCTTAAVPGVSYAGAPTASLPSPAQYLVVEPPRDHHPLTFIVEPRSVYAMWWLNS